MHDIVQRYCVNDRCTGFCFRELTRNYNAGWGMIRNRTNTAIGLGSQLKFPALGRRAKWSTWRPAVTRNQAAPTTLVLLNFQFFMTLYSTLLRKDTKETSQSERLPMTGGWHQVQATRHV